MRHGTQRRLRSSGWLYLAGAVTLAGASMDVTAEGPWERHTLGGGVEAMVGADGARLGDINGDGLMDVVTGFEGSSETWLFLNPGPGSEVRELWPSVSIGHTPEVEDAFFVDVDGDGRLDVVSSDESGGSKNPKGEIRVHFAPSEGDLLDAENWTVQPIPAASHVTEWMYSTAMQIDDEHGPDLVVAGKNHNQGDGTPTSEIGWLRAPADPRNDPDGWAYYKLDDLGWTMSVINSDMDGDGDLDILLTDRKGANSGVRWLENPGPDASEQALTSPWQAHVISTGIAPALVVVADLDGDQLEDVIVPTLDDRLLWYERLDSAGDEWTAHEIDWPGTFGQGKAVATADVNGDDRMDLILSSKSMRTEQPGVVWLEQPDDPRNAQWTRHDLSGPDSYGKYDLVQMIDLDGDGDLDVITTEESRDGYGFGVVWFENPSRSAP